LTKVGIVGANGFFGNTLTKHAKASNFEVFEITKENFFNLKDNKYDFLINSATPSGKFWAQNNPHLDFQKTVVLTADLVYNWNYSKFVQISTMSANETSNHHPYGLNKRAAEIITTFQDSLIVRLGSLYGKGLRKGPLFDLLNNKRLYVDKNSEYNLISTDFCAKWILNNLNKVGIVNVGALDTISLIEIAQRLGIKIQYEGKKEKIFSDNVEEGMPSTKEVWDFVFEHFKK